MSGAASKATVPGMSEPAQTLEFGVTLDSVAIETVHGHTLSLSSHRRGAKHPPHQHVNDYICIVLAGGFAERQKERWQERRSGSFFIHRAGETHHDHFGPHGAVCLSMHLELRRSSSDMTEGLCSTLARSTADQLALELVASSREELVLASLAAQLFEELGLISQACKSGSWIDKIAEAMCDEPARRWSLRELAAIAQRHPVHLAQAFRAQTGVSIGMFQRRRRIMRLCLALRSGSTPLATLAAELGYSDQSHMTSELRTAIGMSPGRYRRLFH